MREVPHKPQFVESSISTEELDRFNVLKRDEEITEKRKHRLYLTACVVISAVIVSYQFQSQSSYNTVWPSLKYISGFIFDVAMMSLLVFLSSFFILHILRFFYETLFEENIVGKTIEKIIGLCLNENDNSSELEELRTKIQKYSKAQADYDDALKQYEYDMASFRIRYPNIEKFNYDRAEYIRSYVPIIKERLNNVISHIEMTNNKKWWYELSPKDFEEEVAAWFVRQGYEAEITSYVSDGGVDIILNRAGRKSYVQCKHYRSPVGVSVVRELYGVICSDMVTEGILVCLNTPTQGAVEFADNNFIRIITAEELASVSVNGPRLSRDVLQYEKEAYIGSKAPFLFVGQFGVFFDVFTSYSEAKQFIDTLPKYGKESGQKLYYSDISVGDLKFVVVSNAKYSSYF